RGEVVEALFYVGGRLSGEGSEVETDTEESGRRCGDARGPDDALIGVAAVFGGDPGLMGGGLPAAWGEAAAHLLLGVVGRLRQLRHGAWRDASNCAQRHRGDDEDEHSGDDDDGGAVTVGADQEGNSEVQRGRERHGPQGGSCDRGGAALTG